MSNNAKAARVRLGPVANELINGLDQSPTQSLEDKITEILTENRVLHECVEKLPTHREQAQSSSELSPSNVAMLQDVLDKLTGLENRVKDLSEAHLRTIKETTTGFGALAQEMMCTRNLIAGLAPNDKGAQSLIAEAREIVAGITDKALPDSMLRAAHEMAQKEEQRRFAEFEKEHTVTPEPELPVEKHKGVSAEPEREM